MTVVRQLGELLIQRRLTICTAESLTAGHVQALIASSSGSSQYFAGGVTAYNIEQKVALLHVDRTHAASVNCVSDRVVQQMATGACTMFRADIAVATTGYAEPSPAECVVAPFALFAIDFGGRVTSGRIDAAGLDRVAVQRHVAREVLRKLVDALQA